MSRPRWPGLASGTEYHHFAIDVLVGCDKVAKSATQPNIPRHEVVMPATLKKRPHFDSTLELRRPEPTAADASGDSPAKYDR